MPSAGSAQVKHAYYGRPDVVDRYLHFRYGGIGGRNVARREKELFLQCLGAVPSEGLVADLGCGPGRAAEWFEPKRLIGVDRSAAMLNAARERYRWVIQADLTRLPFRPGVLSLAFSLRVWIHLPDPGTVAREVARSLGPGGRWIFEIYLWSFQPVGFSGTGGRNYHHSVEEVSKIVAHHGLEARRTVSDFLLPPSFLRWLGPLALLEEFLSRRLQDRRRIIRLLETRKTSLQGGS